MTLSLVANFSDRLTTMPSRSTLSTNSIILSLLFVAANSVANTSTGVSYSSANYNNVSSPARKNFINNQNASNNGRLAGSSHGINVPAQATAAEAVKAASLPNNPIINTVGNYQDINYRTDKPSVFGEQLFRGAFATTSGSTFNDSYIIHAGDNVQIRMWGAYQYAATMTVDQQGNVFIPNVGPVRIAGITNAQLQSRIMTAVSTVYRSNVGVYASLENAQPIKVFVTGFARQPGYYAGLASDSVLSYIDRAGGVDPERGSFIDIDIIRGGQIIQRVNLYDFLLGGWLQPLSFRDGDIIRIKPQKQTFSIEGHVNNPHIFEFDEKNLTVGDALNLATLKASATNLSIARNLGRKQITEYYALDEAFNLPLNNGDKLVVTSDTYAGSIAVSVQGAHKGNGAVVLPYGSRLADLVSQIQPTKLANMQQLTIYRPTVAKQQHEMINKSLDRLEEMVLASQSTTKEEAELRQQDAELVKQFIAKARNVKPSGQIVVVEDSWRDVILQQGDIIEIPLITSVITVNGNVRAQGALTYNPNYTVGNYIAKSGDFDDNADRDNILIIHQNGEHEVVTVDYQIQQGDEIMVLPKIKTKRVEITRGISQIVYQLAVATRVILSL